MLSQFKRFSVDREETLHCQAVYSVFTNAKLPHRNELRVRDKNQRRASRNCTGNNCRQHCGKQIREKKKACALCMIIFRPILVVFLRIIGQGLMVGSQGDRPTWGISGVCVLCLNVRSTPTASLCPVSPCRVCWGYDRRDA